MVNARLGGNILLPNNAGATGGYSAAGAGRAPGDSGHSPDDSASSCGSSYDGADDRDEHQRGSNDNGNCNSYLLQPLSSQEGHHSPTLKRIRLSEGWAT